MFFPVLDASDQQNLEKRFIEMGMSSPVMMEAVATQIANRLARQIKKNKSKQIILLAGLGNNGADGLAVLRGLRHLPNLRKTVLRWPGERNTAATLQEKFLRETYLDDSLEFITIGSAALPPLPKSPGLFVEALFGVGFKNKPAPEWAAGFLQNLAAFNREHGLQRISVDTPAGLLPSGEVAETYRALDCDVCYAVTGPKLCQVQSQGVDHSGTIVSVDLGLPATAIGVFDWAEIRGKTLDAIFQQNKVNIASLKKGDHKNLRGRVLVVGGSVQGGGATMLSARTALQSGLGYGTVVEMHAKPSLRESIDTAGEWVVTGEPKTWPECLAANDALIFGCGLPSGGLPKNELPKWEGFLDALGKFLVSEKEKVLVVDGGGLSTFCRWIVEQKIRDHATPIVFTPHPKEADEMLEIFSPGANIKSRVEKFFTLRDAMIRRGLRGALLLKGAYPLTSTLTASARPHCWNLAAPQLATAGSGDVLTGAIAAAFVRLRGTSDLRASSALDAAVFSQAKAADALEVGALASEIGSQLAKHLRAFLNQA